MGTHGRSFWILDDVTPLRQINEKVASSAVQLFKPQVAIRMRRDQNTDTPLPPEIPAGKNPPDGAILDYYLSSQASSPVTLEILTAQGKLVRKYSSDDKPAPAESDLNVPTYWIREPRTLSPQAGIIVSFGISGTRLQRSSGTTIRSRRFFTIPHALRSGRWRCPAPIL